MRRGSLWLIFVLALHIQNAAGQTTGPYALDQVTTAKGIGSPAIGPLNPSQQNELAFLIVGGDYSNGWCGNQSSYLSGMSSPWTWAGTGRDQSSSFAANPNGPFFIGYPSYSNGPSAPPDYPFWTLASSAVSASGTAVQQSCYTTAWSAVLALFKYVGNQLPGSPVAQFTAAAGAPGGSGTKTFTPWGLGYASTNSMFLIGYMWTQGVGPNGGQGQGCNEGPYITPTVSLSDPVGNKYQIIADVTGSHVINISGCDRAEGNRIIMFIVPDFKGANGANTLTIAEAGGDWSIANSVYIAAVVYQKPPMPSMVDPVTDTPATNLLNGPNVTSAPHLLATGGRLVQGVAADGVTEVVVRVPATNVGDQVSLTLMNDQSSPSNSSDDDGGLGQIGASAFTQNQVNASAQDTGGQGPYAFAIYRAPVDFARSSGSDNGLAQRSVSIQVQNTSQGTTTTLPITIVRPPVALIHGLWSNSSSWSKFSPLVTGAGTADSRFSVQLVTYDTPIGSQITSTDPVYSTQRTSAISANSLGYNYNAGSVLSQVGQWIDTVKNGKNPANIPIAAVQADIVGHSMGGVIARTLVLQKRFLNDDTFGQGTIHKVITIDTPHLGSQLGYALLDPQEKAADGSSAGCLQKFLAGFGNFAINTAILNDGTIVPGAVADLQGDDTTGQLSGILGTLKTSAPHPIPVSFLAGVYQNFASLNTPSMADVIRGRCSHDPLALQLFPTSWQSIFHNNPNDAIVSENSQLNALIPSPGSQFFGTMHSPDIWKLGFSSPSVIDGGVVPTQVIFLLNTSWKKSAYYYMINP